MECVPLLPEIAHDPINLFDHGFRKNFNLCANLDCRDRSTGDHEAGDVRRGGMGNQLTEGSIATPRTDPVRSVLRVQNTLLCIDPCMELYRQPKCV
jgi:hypothetical protein